MEDGGRRGNWEGKVAGHFINTFRFCHVGRQRAAGATHAQCSNKETIQMHFSLSTHCSLDAAAGAIIMGNEDFDNSCLLAVPNRGVQL